MDRFGSVRGPLVHKRGLKIPMLLLLLALINLDRVASRVLPRTPHSQLLLFVGSSVQKLPPRLCRRHGVACMVERNPQDESEDNGVSRKGFLAAAAPALFVAGLTPSVLTVPTSARYYDVERERIFDTRKQSFLPADPERLISPRFDAKFICLGERHTHPLHHRMQFNIVKATHKLTRSFGETFAIGLEMFYRQQQNPLDRYVFQHGDLRLLKVETRWDQTWGFDFSQYAKIFRYARENRIRLVGLNAPGSLVRLVNKVGVGGLPEELQAVLPEMDLGQESHRRRFVDAIYAFPHMSGLDGDAMDRMYQAQTLWDEYMAESASRYLMKNGGRLAVLAGNGHVQARDGIPDRVERRTGLKPFTVVPVDVAWTQEGLPDIDHPPGPHFADWVYFTQEEIVLPERGPGLMGYKRVA